VHWIYYLSALLDPNVWWDKVGTIYPVAQSPHGRGLAGRLPSAASNRTNFRGGEGAALVDRRDLCWASVSTLGSGVQNHYSRGESRLDDSSVRSKHRRFGSEPRLVHRRSRY
jgi:hypothetical protein